MPMQTAIRVEAFWVEEPGDGSQCLCCGDQAWLRQFRLHTRIFNHVQPQAAVLCTACKENE